MKEDFISFPERMEDDMSYRSEVFGQEYTVADQIFDDESIKEYEAGNSYFVELYEQINEVFPEKFRNIGR